VVSVEEAKREARKLLGDRMLGVGVIVSQDGHPMLMIKLTEESVEKLPETINDVKISYHVVGNNQ